MSIRSPKQALDATAEAGRWAPSVHNTQPWTFAVSGEEISLGADTARKLQVSDVTIRPGDEVEAGEHTWVLGGEIQRRRTHRAGFAEVPVPGELIESLVKAAPAPTGCRPRVTRKRWLRRTRASPSVTTTGVAKPTRGRRRPGSWPC
ncbi:hypothetical protein [Nonomuraea zeae]|uniref:hypothetical protein n=1 Tax=Nonomuraea zeae TaxID=1642303 RepID=UPI00197EE0B8|nr:hypothetical protein [Nonomuraea zeae]